MSCPDENLRARLDDWVDGLLAPAPAAEMARHVERCDDCRRDAEALRALLRDAAALPPAREPARDLWDGIASRLREEPRQEPGRGEPAPPPLDGNLPPRAGARRGVRPLWAWSGWVAAAACLALLLLSRAPDGSTGRTAAGEAGAIPAAASAGQPLLAAALLDLEAGSRQAQAEYMAALRGVEANAAAPTPDGLAVMRGLQTIDAALAQTRAALEKEPGNPLLTRLLASSYAERIELLRRATLQTTRAVA